LILARPLEGLAVPTGSRQVNRSSDAPGNGQAGFDSPPWHERPTEKEHPMKLDPGTPTTLVCYFCPGYPTRKVMRTLTNKSSDPTEVYVLACGHRII